MQNTQKTSLWLRMRILGLQLYLILRPSIFQKTGKHRFWGPILTGLKVFATENHLHMEVLTSINKSINQTNYFIVHLKVDQRAGQLSLPHLGITKT